MNRAYCKHTDKSIWTSTDLPGFHPIFHALQQAVQVVVHVLEHHVDAALHVVEWVHCEKE